MGEMWIYPYESDNFRENLAHLWNQLKPLYQQLHAYVRRKLREVSLFILAFMKLLLTRGSIETGKKKVE